ncbi:MAG: KamA family radical SAM protein [Planctomycetota bacterium]|jgi:lysine 2,3-aminomutase
MLQDDASGLGEKTQADAGREVAGGGVAVALEDLREASPGLYKHLASGGDTEEVRDNLFRHLEIRERSLLSADDTHHPLENANTRQCISALKSVFAPIHEKTTGVSALETLISLAAGGSGGSVSPGFLEEFIHLFRGVDGNSGIYRTDEDGQKKVPEFLKLKEREAALKRSEILDGIASRLKERTARYPSGLEKEVEEKRAGNRKRILDYFGGTEADWADAQWHLDHVIKEARILADLIELTPEQVEAVDIATKNKIPFGVTPYYMSLMDRELDDRADHAVRAQVIPPPDYVAKMAAHGKDRATHFDFMGEHDTSPEDLITRRYPRIAILKPFNTCSQICVYCQRNWEIEECMADDALADPAVVDAAVEWFRGHPGVGEILITGGDPMVCSNEFLEDLLTKLSSIDHVYRIRFGTRTPVVLPMRWTDELANLVGRFHVPGRREICIITHFEHSYEITPEARDAVRRIRKAGMAVYNQEVFTIENSRRFETVKLRLDMRSIGIDPYYTFNMKGKEETDAYLVPIARILQERKEEARLLPGIDRTDEPVFNVPRLGKNHLRALQDHRLVMIRPDGRRVYEFHPWEKNLALVPPYYYTDVSIHEYLKRLKGRGEDPEEYKTIWYYF